MSLNTDRPINRAPVVACAISATRNHLRLNMPGTLNPLLRNIHAETQKLRKRSARVAAFRTEANHQSTNRPLMHSACPPRCLRHSRWLLSTRAYPSARAGVALIIESGANRQFSQRSRPRRRQTSRDFVPWRFLDAGRLSARSLSSCQHPKPAQCGRDANSRRGCSCLACSMPLKSHGPPQRTIGVVPATYTVGSDLARGR
jgi:hypothetical protein